jgi:cardiolipin synthase A/B
LDGYDLDEDILVVGEVASGRPEVSRARAPDGRDVLVKFWARTGIDPDIEDIFRATASGLAQVDAAEMRAATVLQHRWMAFSVDRVAGSVFRGREVLVRTKAKIEVPEGEPLVFLESNERHSTEDMGEVYAALENEDEVILGTVSLPEPPFKGYAVFAVRDGAIDSLPGRARDGLKEAILKAAIAARAAPASATVDAALAAAKSASNPQRRTIEARFDHDDLILDGVGHRDALEAILGRARQKALIHSTFVTPNGWNVALPMLLGAASKGVKLHVFWGQADDLAGNSSSRAACEALRAAIADAGRADDIIVHPFTTGSHAKLVIADDGQGGWSALVGSCNWLSTDFETFESSFRTRDPVIVGELMNHLATIGRIQRNLEQNCWRTYGIGPQDSRLAAANGTHNVRSPALGTRSRRSCARCTRPLRAQDVRCKSPPGHGR